jgi:hypothetical protein
MFERIDKIARRVVSAKNIQKPARSAHVCFEAQKIIIDLFPKFSHQIMVESFSKGSLKLVSSSPAVNYEIQFKKDEIINKINQKLKSQMVTNLRFNIR